MESAIHASVGRPLELIHLVSQSRLLFFLLFILRERASGEGAESKRRARERERERIPSRLHTTRTEPDVELKPTNREIMPWTEVRRLTD